VFHVNADKTAQAKPFKTPSSAQAIRIRSTIDLSYPTSSTQRKSVLIAPISSLPLQGADATQRIKVLAGPRWTPGYPGRDEAAESGKEGADGWIKIAEERFPDARTNRWSVGSMLEKLVQAANVSSLTLASVTDKQDSQSSLSPTIPIDNRHLLSRQVKKRSKPNAGAWRKTEALGRRPGVVGGVRGFPEEWLQSKTGETVAALPRVTPTVSSPQ
jgi:small subunit ribosomal protein S35